MIKLTEVRKIYNKGKENQVNALDDVSLEILDGESIAIIGASGAGKTTLMNVICGLETVTSGSVFAEKNDITKFSDSQLSEYRNKSIGLVMQDFNLIGNCNVMDNVLLPLYLRKKSKLNKKDLAKKQIFGVGLENRAFTKVKFLSGGEKQRVAIARALVTEPQIILADEPTGSLDSKNSKSVMELLMRINALGKTLIVITHNIELAKYCKRIIEMKDGKIISDKIEEAK